MSDVVFVMMGRGRGATTVGNTRNDQGMENDVVAIDGERGGAGRASSDHSFCGKGASGMRP